MGADQHLTLVILYSLRKSFKAHISIKDEKFKANNKKTIRNRHLLKDSTKNGKLFYYHNNPCSGKGERSEKSEKRQNSLQKLE